MTLASRRRLRQKFTTYRRETGSHGTTDLKWTMAKLSLCQSRNCVTARETLRGQNLNLLVMCIVFRAQLDLGLFFAIDSGLRKIDK